MNRLQKKCLIATAGTHLLLVVLLLCSGFIKSKPKTDDTPPLDVIPANVIEAALNSGVKDAPKPAPQPLPKPPEPQAQPKPPEPKPEPPPEKQPDPEQPKPPAEKLPDPDLTPVVRPKPVHEVKPDLTKVVVHKPKPNISKPTEPDTSAEDEAREQARIAAAKAKAKARAIREIALNIKNNSSSPTEVSMPEGNGSVSFASYASVVKSIYEAAWQPPGDTASDDANTLVKVTIASDGNVISAHVITPSGDASVDASVRRTLEKVTFVREFPDGAKEKEKTFIINFNLKAKRMSA